MDASRETQKQPHQKQHVYRTEKIAVFWNPDVCINSHRCVQGLPAVFQPSARPWIHVDAASADAIAQVVAQCPSGALHFERLDGGAQEEVAERTTISPQPNGPLYVRGWMCIIGQDGSILREDSRMALCRCGQSRKKPFCDGSHSTTGFQAE
ncbi:MAG: (4Fe-4S)-binding protein [Nitrososphaerota archaeon]